MPARSKSVRKSERELVTTHTFDAPRELVWKAWTDPKLIPTAPLFDRRGQDGCPAGRPLAIRPA